MINRYPGTCACGAFVDKGEGETFKADGRWLVRCTPCQERPAPPEREMLGSIYWPNGMGETICTIEYEEAVSAARDAREAFERHDATCDYQDAGERAEANRLENAMYAAENKVAELQAEGGHLGERITYDAPDPMTALLAGGSITIAPGGGMRVVQN